MQPVNFEGFTSWPLIRRTPPASDKQLQIEISMRRTSPQSFIWIHLHTSSINMSSIQTLKPTQKPSTRSSETETSSGSHEAVLPNHSLIGHISREGETSEEPDTSSEISCQGWLGVQEKSVSILPKKCVCVCACRLCPIFNLWYSWTKDPFKDDELLYWYFYHFRTCHHVAHTCATLDP